MKCAVCSGDLGTPEPHYVGALAVCSPECSRELPREPPKAFAAWTGARCSRCRWPALLHGTQCEVL